MVATEWCMGFVYPKFPRYVCVPGLEATLATSLFALQPSVQENGFPVLKTVSAPLLKSENAYQTAGVVGQLKPHGVILPLRYGFAYSPIAFQGRLNDLSVTGKSTIRPDHFDDD